MTSPIHVAAFEGTSRVAGIALGALRLLTALRECSGAMLDAPGEASSRLATYFESPVIVREVTKNSAMVCRKVRAAAEAGNCRLLLGGEHLVTFPVLEVMVKRHPGLKLVVLDAHHDAYPHPVLNHWSLFHFATRELEIPTLVVGARHELDRADSACQILSADDVRERGVDAALDRIGDFVGGAPFYFSVDVDVVDPRTLRAVSDPVPGGISGDELLALVRGVLGRQPVAMDVVEYNALRDHDASGLAVLRPMLVEVARWLA
ncbi:MAG: arginase family protein [Myxococcales bacterium]|nr:arginase family protein [Myxococcales bacterium]